MLYLVVEKSMHSNSNKLISWIFVFIININFFMYTWQMQTTYQKYFTFHKNRLIMQSQTSFKRTSIPWAINQVLKGAVFYLPLRTGQWQYLMFVYFAFHAKLQQTMLLKMSKSNMNIIFQKHDYAKLTLLVVISISARQ